MPGHAYIYIIERKFDTRYSYHLRKIAPLALYMEGAFSSDTDLAVFTSHVLSAIFAASSRGGSIQYDEAQDAGDFLLYATKDRTRFERKLFTSTQEYMSPDSLGMTTTNRHMPDLQMRELQEFYIGMLICARGACTFQRARLDFSFGRFLNDYSSLVENREEEVARVGRAAVIACKHMWLFGDHDNEKLVSVCKGLMYSLDALRALKDHIGIIHIDDPSLRRERIISGTYTPNVTAYNLTLP